MSLRTGLLHHLAKQWTKLEVVIVPPPVNMSHFCVQTELVSFAADELSFSQRTAAIMFLAS